MRRPLSGRRGAPSNTPSQDAGTTRRWRPRTPSAGLLVGIVALVVALSGTAYAGATLGAGSVGTKQLQKGAVTSKKIASNAVTSGKIQPGSIGSKKLKSTLVVPNANHANMADTATNATNATTAASATALANVSYIQGPTTTATHGTATAPKSTFGIANCPSGTAAIAGGFQTSAAGVEISDSHPTGATSTTPASGWDGYVDNFNATGTQTFNAWAICTPVTAGTLTPATMAAKTAKAHSTR
jgi:hypothetical protein